VDLELTETVEKLHSELAKAAISGAEKDIQFPVDGIHLELHIAVRREARAEATSGIRLIEAGDSGTPSQGEVNSYDFIRCTY
jgi:hypothetical protein